MELKDAFDVEVAGSDTCYMVMLDISDEYANSVFLAQKSDCTHEKFCEFVTKFGFSPVNRVEVSGSTVFIHVNELTC